MIEKYQIPTPKQKKVKIDEEISFDTFPCVLKVDLPIHKSDIGAVITNIQNEDELKSAKKIILDNLKKHNINAEYLLIQEQIEGIELILGGKFDKIFEEVIILGSGGTLVEIIKDITYIDTKADEEEIKKAIFKTKIAKIFPKFRGKKYNLNALIDTIKKIQTMFEKEDLLEFDINPLIINEKGCFAVDVRIKKGEKNKRTFIPKTHSLFENKNVAIIGASEKPQKVGYAIAKNSLNSKANIYFVNPHLNELFGKKVYHSIDELPKIDTAVIAIPTKFVIDTVEELAKKNVKNIIVISAGFKEAGNKEGELKLKKIADKYNINLIGPNCLGIYNAEMELNLTFGKSPIKKGNIGLISQSGAVLTALLDKAAFFNIGFSHIISMGNMADFNFAHAINELNNQNSCKIISIYAEGLQFGKEFLNSIRNSKKPILLFKAGKSKAAKKAAFSHTGNLAGDYEMIMTLSEIAGAKIKPSVESLIFAPKFENINEAIIVTNAGGPGTILTDIVSKYKKIKPIDEYLDKLNEILPSTWSHNNPIDIIGDATSERYKAALEVLKNEKLIFVIITPQFMTDNENIAKILTTFKNTVPIFLGKESIQSAINVLEAKKIIYFTSLEAVLRII